VKADGGAWKKLYSLRIGGSYVLKDFMHDKWQSYGEYSCPETTLIYLTIIICCVCAHDLS
jgi:hypothetical protein